MEDMNAIISRPPNILDISSIDYNDDLMTNMDMKTNQNLINVIIKSLLRQQTLLSIRQDQWFSNFVFLWYLQKWINDTHYTFDNDATESKYMICTWINSTLIHIQVKSNACLVLMSQYVYEVLGGVLLKKKTRCKTSLIIVLLITAFSLK